MNDEIKEILDDLLFTTTLPNVSIKLNKEKLNQLKNYITNLQQENQELKSELECYENGVYFSSKVDELQQENERLKKDYYEEYDIHLKDKTYYFNLFEDYKSRCEKAILMLKELNIKMKNILNTGIDIKEISDIEDTLNGRSDE